MSTAITKICSTCKEEKEVIAFAKKNMAKTGLQSSCKKCRNKKYKKISFCTICNIEIFNSKTKLCYDCYQKEYVKKKQQKRKEYKYYISSLGCTYCKENHPDCLETHHLFKGAKRFSSRTQSIEYNVEDISKGIAIVLCANCHSLFHAHFGGKNAYFPEQTKESTCNIIKLQYRQKGV